MSEQSAFELEGRLNGLREALAMIAAVLARDESNGLRLALEERIALLNHQEDPGAVPHASFAVEAAATREIELLISDMRSLMASDNEKA
ncbi:hypothetical protein [Tianweitania sediminis]|uniref:Uncharacterized protein n=1 Tax=Tianweitania sediminis TaxID=1502156 RepID=A0A8J7UI90_9HYPH|nr:hypothetical protein [Tianweitania sediminis]MBP0437535.1 hypothetical protein [Tianweitania sediminis]